MSEVWLRARVFTICAAFASFLCDGNYSRHPQHVRADVTRVTGAESVADNDGDEDIGDNSGNDNDGESVASELVFITDCNNIFSEGFQFVFAAAIINLIHSKQDVHLIIKRSETLL